MDPFIATPRLKYNEQIPECAKGRTPGDLTSKQLMARKLRTKKGKETSAKWNWMVELVFGQITRFPSVLLPSVKKMQGEWTIVCLTHILLKEFKAKNA